MKKILFWPGLLCLSFSFLYTIPIFNEPDYFVAFLFIIFGTILNTLALWGKKYNNFDKKYLIILIPLIMSIFIIPFPYNLGLIVLTISILGYSFKKFLLKKEKGDWICTGIALSGVILTVQTMFYPVYSTIVSHFHRIDFLSPPISSIGNTLGLQTSVQNGMIHLQTLESNYAITTTFEKLGFFPWFNILIGSLVLFYLLKNKKQILLYLASFLIISGFYLLLRYVVLLSYFNQTMDVNVFWDKNILFISFIPLILLFMRFLKLKDFDIDFDCFKSFKPNKNSVVSILLIFVFIFSLTGGFVFHDPGVEKDGRILIDEYHSAWENTTREMDKEWYGMLSTYNYYNWAEWLDKYYTVERNVDNLLTSSVLDDYDILILKCPTNKYTDQEIKDIVSFVENGGGLYMIGDHTNVFGMNMFLNQVSEEFGIEFKTDATYDFGTGGLSEFKTSSIFPHPVVQNMEKFDFKTSCTLKAPINSENVMIGNMLLGEPGTYSTENFFRRELVGSLDVEYGLLLQVVSLKHGKGRVLAFTDSTCFSNFCMFMDGYRDFNLGTIEYLNRENSLSYLNTVLMGLAIVSFLLSIYFLRNKHKTKILFIFFLSGILAFSIATPVFSYINHVNYDLPVPNEEFRTVCFDDEYSNVNFESDPANFDSKPKNTFSTFFVWTQRVGFYPYIEKTLDNSLEKGDITVIVNPIKSFNEEDLENIESYLEKGGNLLLMDGMSNGDSTSNELLEKFDIKIQNNYSASRVFKSYSYADEMKENVGNIFNNTEKNESDNTTIKYYGMEIALYLTFQ